MLRQSRLSLGEAGGGGKPFKIAPEAIYTYCCKELQRYGVNPYLCNVFYKDGGGGGMNCIILMGHTRNILTDKLQSVFCTYQM